MVFGVGSGISAVSCGRLVKLIPQYMIIYGVYLVNAGLVVFLLVWERVPSYTAAFVTFFVWGLCDGIWNSIPPSKMTFYNSSSSSHLAHFLSNNLMTN